MHLFNITLLYALDKAHELLLNPYKYLICNLPATKVVCKIVQLTTLARSSRGKVNQQKLFT